MITQNTFKVDFLVPGFSKCGTTTLCDLLAQHPQLYLPQGEDKEPMYFIYDDYKKHEETYRNLFIPAQTHQLIGEGSTFYSTHDKDVIVSNRIFEHNPDIKLIFIARDPIKRIESSFREFHHSGHCFGLNPPFALRDALQELPSLIEDTRYWTRLNNFRSRFPDNQILVLLLEELESNPQVVLRRCYEFLGVDPHFNAPTPNKQLNEGEQKLFDSQLLRWLRNWPHTAFKISRVSLKCQDRLFKRIGLRKPFAYPIQWEPELKCKTQMLLAEDAQLFLDYAGKNNVVWRTFFNVSQPQ